MSRKLRTSWLVWVVLSGLLYVCVGCGEDRDRTDTKKFDIEKEYDAGPVSVCVRVDSNNITIAQTVTVELEAAAESRYKVVMPQINEVLANFGIVDWRNMGEHLDDEGRVVKAYRYRLEPFLSGTYPIPAFKFSFYDVNDTAAVNELSTEPVEIEVTSLLGEDRDNLVIADIEGVVEPAREPSYWWAWVIGAMVVGGAVAAFLLLRKKKVAALVRIFKPAHEVAYERLRKLVAEELVEAGRIKEFYERVSGILRHYIEDRFELRAPERTTEEFLAELRETMALPEDYRGLLEEFLKHCDLVKFARHEPSSEQIQRTFNVVKEFIEVTKSPEHRIDVTDVVSAEPIQGEVA